MQPTNGLPNAQALSDNGLSEDRHRANENSSNEISVTCSELTFQCEHKGCQKYCLQETRQNEDKVNNKEGCAIETAETEIV